MYNDQGAESNYYQGRLNGNDKKRGRILILRREPPMIFAPTPKANPNNILDGSAPRGPRKICSSAERKSKQYSA
jgi:hypothetical protein